MRALLAIIAIIGVLALSGCGYKEGVATGEQKAYLYFTGHVNDVMVSVDGAGQFSVKEGRDNQYEIKPGKHIVVVYRADQAIVTRDIFVGDGVAKEIEVK